MGGRLRVVIGVALSLAGVVLPPSEIARGVTRTVTFQFTGAPQAWVVPSGVTAVQIEAWGGQGGGQKMSIEEAIANYGGEGGYARGTLAVSPGETLHVYVGGKGQDGYDGGLGGWNGGGSGGGASTLTRRGGGGGGASDVRRGGDTLSHRRIVAGGGGGSGNDGPNDTSYDGADSEGGAGGGLSGQNGYDNDPNTWTGGGGGTQTAGGSGHDYGLDRGGRPGSFGQGGLGGMEANYGQGGGGGGGWYGGGGGRSEEGNPDCPSGGGGGSSYISGLGSATTATDVRVGHGSVLFTYEENTAPTAQPVAPSSGTVWSHTNAQTFTILGTDPETQSYASEIVVSSMNGTSRTLMTPITPSGTNASVSANPKLGPGTYTWQARACDTGPGNLCSGWTTARTLTVAPNAPPSVTSSAPPDAQSWTHNDSHAFSVTATDPEADTYSAEVVVTPIGGGAARTLVSGTVLSGGTAIAIASPKLSVGSYTWQTRACDALGACSNWTIARALTVQPNRAPATTLVSPGDAQLWGYNTPQTFTVNAVDADGDSYTAEVVISPTGGGADRTAVTTSAASGQDVSVTLSPSLPPGSYTWKARACDLLSLCGAYSAPRALNINTNQAPPATLVSPADEIKLTTASAHTFVVNASDPDLDSYTGEIVITPAGGGSDVTLTTSLTLSGQDATANASPKLARGSYTWKARACDINNVCGAYTGTRTLVVNDPPDVPSLVQPGPGATFDYGQAQEFRLRSTDPDSDSYQVEIDVQSLAGVTQRTLTTASGGSGTEVNITASPAIPAGVYKWRARGCDPSGSGICGAWTGLHELHIEAAPVCPVVVFDGYAGDLYARLRSAGSPTVGTLSVCLGAAQAGGALQAVRVTVSDLGADNPVTEGDASACQPPTPDDNQTKPLFDVTDGGTHARGHLRAEQTRTSVCFSVAESGEQLVSYSWTVAHPNPSNVPHVDPQVETGPAPSERRPLRVDRPSAACHTASQGTLRRVLNANVMGQWVSMHARQATDYITLCMRTDGPTDRFGGHVLLTHSGQAQNPITVTPGLGPDDAGNPCSEGNTTVASPLNAVVVRVKRNTSDPVALCLSAATLDGGGPMLKSTMSIARSPGMPEVNADWRQDAT